ncbi:MAG: type II toxin-antitoxin system ChpB family toxin [Sulfuricella sp.]|nr:type II toxin-antitoxin system ChpB family toxin [Sulfuricella sp.]
MRIPGRGEIWTVNLNPTAGKEQQGMRPILVVSDKEFNRAGLVLVCPITQGGNQARFAGFAVSLMNTGTATQGVVMCNQLRTIDHGARGAKFVEDVPDYVTDDVLARVQAILE